MDYICNIWWIFPHFVDGLTLTQQLQPSNFCESYIHLVGWSTKKKAGYNQDRGLKIFLLLVPSGKLT